MGREQRQRERIDLPVGPSFSFLLLSVADSYLDDEPYIGKAVKSRARFRDLDGDWLLCEAYLALGSFLERLITYMD